MRSLIAILIFTLGSIVEAAPTCESHGYQNLIPTVYRHEHDFAKTLVKTFVHAKSIAADFSGPGLCWYGDSSTSGRDIAVLTKGILFYGGYPVYLARSSQRALIINEALSTKDSVCEAQLNNLKSSVPAMLVPGNEPAGYQFSYDATTDSYLVTYPNQPPGGLKFQIHQSLKGVIVRGTAANYLQYCYFPTNS